MPSLVLCQPTALFSEWNPPIVGCPLNGQMESTQPDGRAEEYKREGSACPEAVIQAGAVRVNEPHFVSADVVSLWQLSAPLGLAHVVAER